MHTAEAAAAAPAAAPTADPAAPGTFWQFCSKCSDPSSSDPSSLFQEVMKAAETLSGAKAVASEQKILDFQAQASAAYSCNDNSWLDADGLGNGYQLLSLA